MNNNHLQAFIEEAAPLGGMGCCYHKKGKKKCCKKYKKKGEYCKKCPKK